MYTTQTQLESRLGRVLTDEQSSYYDTVLSAGVDAQVNYLTGTVFGSDEIVDVYVETDQTSSTLVIPTMHDITSVSYVSPDGSEEAIPVDQYYLYPRGEANKYAIKHLNSEWSDETHGAYKITGKLGYAEIPDDIIQLATEMAMIGIDTNVNGYQSEKVGDWAVTYGDPKKLSADSLMTLSRYKRLSRSI